MVVAGGALAVAILIAVGFAVQPYVSASAVDAAALTAATNDYCAQYQSALAAKLNTNTSALQSANQAAAQAVLDQMVKDGKITSAEEQQMEQRLKADNYQICPGFASGHAHGKGGPMGGLRGALTPTDRANIEQAVATALHLSTTQVENDLTSGKTIAQIASAQNVQASSVESAYLSAVQTALKGNASLSSTQVTTIYNAIKSAADQGHYLLLGHPHGPNGGFGGQGDPPSGNPPSGNPPSGTSAPASN